MRQHAADLLTDPSTGSSSSSSATLRRLLHLAWILPAALLAVGLVAGSNAVAGSSSAGSTAVVVLALGLAAGTSLSGSI